MKYALLTLIALALTATGCSKKSSSSQDSLPKSQASTAGSDSYETATYKLTLVTPPTIAKGKTASFQVILTTKGGYHINKDYPYRFECSKAMSGISCSKQKLGRADGTFSETKAVIPVPFTANKSGELKLGGVYRFSVCSEQNCLMDKKTLTKSVTVQ